MKPSDRALTREPAPAPRYDDCRQGARKVTHEFQDLLITTALLLGCPLTHELSRHGASFCYWYNTPDQRAGGMRSAFSSARNWMIRNGHEKLSNEICYPKGN